MKEQTSKFVIQVIFNSGQTSWLIMFSSCSKKSSTVKENRKVTQRDRRQVVDSQVTKEDRKLIAF